MTKLNTPMNKFEMYKLLIEAGYTHIQREDNVILETDSFNNTQKVLRENIGIITIKKYKAYLLCIINGEINIIDTGSEIKLYHNIYVIHNIKKDNFILYNKSLNRVNNIKYKDVSCVSGEHLAYVLIIESDDNNISMYYPYGSTFIDVDDIVYIENEVFYKSLDTWYNIREFDNMYFTLKGDLVHKDSIVLSTSCGDAL